MGKKLVNLKSTLKVVVSRHIIIKLIFISILLSCAKINSKSELIFKDCKVYINGKFFSGKFEFYKGDKYILSNVRKGILKIEKTFKNNTLLMEKSYDDCENGFQRIYDAQGKLYSEGSFSSNKRIGIWKNYIRDSVYFIKY